MSANPQAKAHWVLAVLLLSQVVLMSAYARHPENEQSVLRAWVLAALTPVVGLANSGVGRVTDFWDSYADLRTASEENERLRAELERVTDERNRALEHAAGYDTLRAELALPAQTEYRRLAANVVSRDQSIWYRRLIIDRGTLDGVRREQPVTTTGGIVGRIISVGPNHAVVQLVTDKHAGVGAMLQKSRSMGELRGTDGDEAELKSIKSGTEVEVGELVLTTGLDRIYPKGLVVGTVARIENDPNAPWHRIVVKPAAPLGRIEHVFVLLLDEKAFKMEDASR